jgi:cystathionine beta-lyase
VDNTFASPINQKPLLNGIDLVVHSGTKYLSGHNDLPFGALAGKAMAHKGPIESTAKILGGSLAPYQCYLAERSIKTLALRIQKHNENALYLANYLSDHRSIDQVYYPGLSGHKGHQIALQQMSGFGGMLSFELKAAAEDISKFLKSLRLIRPALSLGGVESLICSPAATSHRGLSAEQRNYYGIKDNLLRLSVGIENVNDLIADLEEAISKIYLKM